MIFENYCFALDDDGGDGDDNNGTLVGYFQSEHKDME